MCNYDPFNIGDLKSRSTQQGQIKRSNMLQSFSRSAGTKWGEEEREPNPNFPRGGSFLYHFASDL